LEAGSGRGETQKFTSAGGTPVGNKEEAPGVPRKVVKGGPRGEKKNVRGSTERGVTQNHQGKKIKNHKKKKCGLVHLKEEKNIEKKIWGFRGTKAQKRD